MLCILSKQPYKLYSYKAICNIKHLNVFNIKTKHQKLSKFPLPRCKLMTSNKYYSVMKFKT